MKGLGWGDLKTGGQAITHKGATSSGAAALAAAVHAGAAGHACAGHAGAQGAGGGASDRSVDRLQGDIGALLGERREAVLAVAARAARAHGRHALARLSAVRALLQALLLELLHASALLAIRALLVIVGALLLLALLLAVALLVVGALLLLAVARGGQQAASGSAVGSGVVSGVVAAVGRATRAKPTVAGPAGAVEKLLQWGEKAGREEAAHQQSAAECSQLLLDSAAAEGPSRRLAYSKSAGGHAPQS